MQVMSMPPRFSQVSVRKNHVPTRLPQIQTYNQQNDLISPKFFGFWGDDSGRQGLSKLDILASSLVAAALITYAACVISAGKNDAIATTPERAELLYPNGMPKDLLEACRKQVEKSLK